MDSWVLSPVVVTEVYHTLVFKRGMSSEDTGTKLRGVVEEEETIFSNHNRRASLAGLSLASKYGLGGRDSLILSTYLFSKSVEMATHDKELLELGSVKAGGRELRLADPLA